MKFKVACDCMTLCPDMYHNFDNVKRDLRYFGFKINDKTNEIESPKKQISLTFKKIRYIDEFYGVYWNFSKGEVKFRLK